METEKNEVVRAKTWKRPPKKDFPAFASRGVLKKLVNGMIKPPHETTKNNRASSLGVAPAAMADMPVGIGDGEMEG